MSNYNARVAADQQYQLIMEYRSIGLTDCQWCKEHGIHPGTFYNWVSRFRKKGFKTRETLTYCKLLVERADAEREHMGLTIWESAPDGKIVVAKNYRSEKEMSYVERIVSLYLNYVELQVVRRISMSMEGWSKRLDGFLEFDGNELLMGSGKVRAEQAKVYAEAEFEKYRTVQERLFMSDDDKSLLELEYQAEQSDD